MTGSQRISFARRTRPAVRGRRLACGVAAAGVAACTVGALAPARLDAQRAEGALGLLIPYAPVVAGLQASTAAPTGLYGIWSNPAAVGDVRATTGAVLGGTLFSGNFVSLSGGAGSALLGSLAFAGVMVDNGSQPVIDPNQNEIGKILIRDVHLSATYGVKLSRRVAAGVSLKLFQARIDCSGQCPPSIESNATAYPVDVGVLYQVRADSTLTVGAAVRNMGAAFQSNDAAQADPLPTRVMLGARWNPAALQVPASGVGVSLLADATQAIVSQTLIAAGGVEVRLRDTFAFRGGITRGDVALSGATIGLSVRQGRRLTIDFARYVSGDAVDAGSAPTFLSIAARF